MGFGELEYFIYRDGQTFQHLFSQTLQRGAGHTLGLTWESQGLEANGWAIRQVPVGHRVSSPIVSGFLWAVYLQERGYDEQDLANLGGI